MDSESGTETEAGDERIRDGSEKDSPRTGEVWTHFLEALIAEVELVSSHFRFTEEYCMEHSLSWLNRKARQARREMKERQMVHSVNGMKSVLMAVDLIFNKGKHLESILSPTGNEQDQTQIERKRQFVSGTWWIPQR